MWYTSDLGIFSQYIWYLSHLYYDNSSIFGWSDIDDIGWHHWAFVRESDDTIKFYRDGIEVSSGSYSGDIVIDRVLCGFYAYFKNFRITIDKDITFKKYNSSKMSKLKTYILEIKTDTDKYHNIKKYFPWRHTRFSKYCEGISNLNLI